MPCGGTALRTGHPWHGIISKDGENMKRILLAVDETKGTKNAFNQFSNFCACMRPKAIVLLYVEKFEGKSLIDAMLGDAELSPPSRKC